MSYTGKVNRGASSVVKLAAQTESPSKLLGQGSMAKLGYHMARATEAMGGKYVTSRNQGIACAVICARACCLCSRRSD